MTTNKIKANQDIFSKLSNFLQDSGHVEKYYDKSLRFFIETDENEQDWLINIEIKCQKNISNKIKFAFLEYNKKSYYVTVGIDISDRNDEVFNELEQYGLKETEINAGILTNLIFTLDISIAKQADPLEIINTIFTEEKPKPGKNYPYELKDIQPFFDNLFFFEIDANCTLVSQVNETDLIKTILLTLNIFNSIQVLRFDEKIVALYIRLCAEEELGLSYDNLLYSFLSFSWKHSFLDIYRCIERLFFIPRTDAFYNAICGQQTNYSQISFIDFSRKLEESTGWRPNEQDSLEKLLEVIENGNLELFKKLQKISNFPYQQSDKNSKITAKFIYTLRNNIVHFRAINEEKNYDDEEWNIIIEFCLEVVIDLYKRYKKYL